MAANPIEKPATALRLRLDAFRATHAERVVSWVRGAAEARWLAPHTPPPLTPEKVCNWSGPGREPLLLVDVERRAPVGYGELNVLALSRREYWLGHLIIDPNRRGMGLGTTLTRMLLRRAFHYRAARRVCLVVFPENRAAVACYRAAGMVAEGYEAHCLPPGVRREKLLLMSATRLA